MLRSHPLSLGNIKVQGKKQGQLSENLRWRGGEIHKKYEKKHIVFYQ